MAVAFGQAALGAFIRCRADHLGALGLDQLLSQPLCQPAHKINATIARAQRNDKFGQGRLIQSHRCDLLGRSCRNTPRITPMAHRQADLRKPTTQRGSIERQDAHVESRRTSTIIDVLLLAGSKLQLGVSVDPVVEFGADAHPEGTWAGRRTMRLTGDPAFELSFWCGTCPCLFRRLEGATETLSIPELTDALAAGVDGFDSEVVRRFGELLPHDDYLPLLLEITPRLVYPGGDGDYFSEEQVQTWGFSDFWGLPENPSVAYYRTFASAISASSHLYEFVVPMVPPAWNDRHRVDHFTDQLATSARPTAVAVSTLDVAAPAVTRGLDYYEHWMLSHFLLDGHHKVEAAALAGRPLRLLSLVSMSAWQRRPADR